jgi:CRP-like cAMP-binding protein
MLAARREMKRRVQALRSLPCLTGCSSAELAHIERLGTTIDIGPGRVLTREGGVGRECFLTLAGVAVAERGGQRIGVIGAGSIAGEMALLDHTARNATVVSATPMRLLVLNDREFRELLEAAPCVAGNLVRIAAQRRVASACPRDRTTGLEPATPTLAKGFRRASVTSTDTR